MGNPFHDQLTAVKKGIRWPASHDRIAGLNVVLTEVTCFLKVYRWLAYVFSLNRRLKYFYKFLEEAKKIEAPLFGLAKSIY